MKKRGRNTLTTFVMNNLDVSKSLSSVKLSNEGPKLPTRKKRTRGSGARIYDHLNKTYDVLRSVSGSQVVRAEREGELGEKKTKDFIENYSDQVEETEESESENCGFGKSDVYSKQEQIDEIMENHNSKEKQPGTGQPQFPNLLDAKVLAELREADEEAINTASLIESMKESIALYTKKENLTKEDEKIIQKKQKELMEKMNEFENVTKKLQRLVGLTTIPSDELGEPSTANPKKMAEAIEKSMRRPYSPGKSGYSSGGEMGSASKSQTSSKPSRDVSPDERLPKVIVCGTEQGTEIPKIIVCETVKKSGGETPLFQQYSGQPHIADNINMNQGFQNLQPFPTQGPYMMNSMSPSALQPWGATNWNPTPSYPTGSYPPGPWSNQRPCAIPPCALPSNDEGMLDQLTGRLDASYKLQEKLANENAEMEGTRYQLQEELLNKDQTVENLQRQLESLQAEMRLVVSENTELKSKVEDKELLYPKTPLCKMRLAKDPICKRELQELCAPEEPNEMESIVTGMENEVRAMQKELALVQQERKALELQKKLLKCAGQHTVTRAVPVCKRQVTEGVSTASAPHLPIIVPAPTPPPTPPPPPPPPPNVINLENQLKEMKEKYQRLHDDYNAKIGEISVLRVELDSSKKEILLSLEKMEESEARSDDLLERMKVLEHEKMREASSKDQLIDLEQQVIVAKQRFRENQDEIEEVRSILQEQTSQIEEYRNKYLSAQETVETQRRQIDILELENNRLAEQVNLEIQRVKSQFQEKLQELTPLPEILRATQLKLQETQQLRAILERNCEDLSRELQESRDKNERLTENLDEIRSNKNLTEAERASLQISLSDGERKMEETKNENGRLKATIARLEELAIQTERRLEEKNHETLQLQTRLETLREESARQVARTKDLCENSKRNLQSQLSELERQLAQSRAAARAAQKDRDEIRQKMQAQISQLNENFDQAQMRIRSLQSHVNYLKTSYTNIFSKSDGISGSEYGKTFERSYVSIESPPIPQPITSSMEADYF